MKFRKLSDAIGAEIMDVDFSAPLSSEVFSAIHRIWLDHNIILLRKCATRHEIGQEVLSKP